MWCTDTQEAKAEFLYKLVNPKNNPTVAWNDKELKTVIDKLFYFSNEVVKQNEFPIKKYSSLKEDEIAEVIAR